ncbi:MAG: BolA family transcriptional regulator [Burkholderiales bacterium]|nr:BolA family transcriptional regulator [Burkholderiales bacterium]
MSVAEEMRRRLQALAPLRLELVDDSARHAGHAGAAPGGNTHWSLLIVSAAFAGKPAVARQRMVYAALGDLMQNPIHALAIVARAPGESDA